MKKGKYLLLLLCIPLLVTGCKKVPKLADGKEIIVELGDKKFTADDFFKALKEDYGTSVLINMVDKYIVEKELTEDMEKEALKKAKSLYDTYHTTYSDNWDYFLYSNNFVNEKEFSNYLDNMYKQNMALENYVKNEVIKEEDLKEYYEKNIYGEITARHILITPETKSDMSDEEIKKAEEKALEQAKELIEQLKKSTELEKDFTALAKEKSKDEGTASLGGLIENFTNESGLVDEFWEASLKLEVGKMTEEPVKTKFGYHIIYKVSQKEKPSLESVKDRVIKGVTSELLSASNASGIYLAGLREKYNMKIHDDIIKNDYDEIMKQLQKDTKK